MRYYVIMSIKKMMMNYWAILAVLCTVVSNQANFTLDDIHEYIQLVHNDRDDIEVTRAMHNLHQRGLTAQRCLQIVAQIYWDSVGLELQDKNQLFRYIGILERSLAWNAGQDSRVVIHAVNREPWSIFPLSDAAADVLPYIKFKSNLGLGIFIWTIVSHHINIMTNNENPTMPRLVEFIQNKQSQLISRIGRQGSDVYFGPDLLLAWAAWCGCNEFIQYFSDNGADVARFGYYAIEAVLQDDALPGRHQRLEIIQRLLDLGASVSSTALFLAEERHPHNIAELLRRHHSMFSNPEGPISDLRRIKKNFCAIM